MRFHGPARIAAHEMCCTTATTTRTSTVPMRPPTCFDGPARTVVHEMWCTTATTTTFFGVPGSLSAKNSYVRTTRSVERRRQNITSCTDVIFAKGGRCSSVYCNSTGCCSSTCCCSCCCCCCGRLSSTRKWWSTGSHPTESLVEQNCVSSGCWLCASNGPKAAVPRSPDGEKNNEKNTPAYAHAPFSTE